MITLVQFSRLFLLSSSLFGTVAARRNHNPPPARADHRNTTPVAFAFGDGRGVRRAGRTRPPTATMTPLWICPATEPREDDTSSVGWRAINHGDWLGTGGAAVGLSGGGLYRNAGRQDDIAAETELLRERLSRIEALEERIAEARMDSGSAIEGDGRRIRESLDEEERELLRGKEEVLERIAVIDALPTNWDGSKVEGLVRIT
uniref:Uncharacterized protein n=1 Tax=Odontella aurita TaxID=265563 RepID=A0A7S4IVU8_9STRA|mmetsp:Transcript_31102/g.93283  ORF Transcript_31102/g.93283 Transcript_31102/m.93283 type:complete len:203 (+) Transcript_31102:21-629(+)